jgi:hypothetical protein
MSTWQEIKMQRWSEFPLPGTIENSESIGVSYSLQTLTSLESVPDESVYPELLTNELYQGEFRFQNFTALSQRMSNHVKEGSLWKVGEFIATRETISSIRHLHYKTHFIIRLREGVNSKDLASTLRSRFNESALVITREEATDIIAKNAPKMATGLAFTQINSILIIAVSCGGLTAVTITNVAGRAKLFSLMRIRGAKKTDSVAFFIPEIVLVSLISVILGIMLGWTLAVGFSSSLTYFLPPLFTGGSFELILGLDAWLFVVLILAVFVSMYVIATFRQQRIERVGN